MAAAAQAVPPPSQAQAGRGKAEAEGQNQGEDPRWRPALGLACQLTVDLPLAKFTVADYVRLQAGSILATTWRVRRDVPLRINGTLIAWAELEGSGNRLAVRLTELA